MFWKTQRQLKKLRTVPASEEALLRGRKALLQRLAMEPPLPRAGYCWSAWKPVFSGLTMLAVVMTGGAGVVYASQGSMPGEALHGVKLLSEEVRASMALSWTSRLELRS